MEVSKEKPRTTIQSFTGLRGLAVLFVCLYHWWPRSVAGGYLGVIIFLGLSGYLVTDGFFREIRRENRLRLKAFYLRRLKRLYPPLLAFILLTSTWLAIFQPEGLQNLRGSVFSTLLGVNNWWQIAQHLSYFERFTNQSIYTHLWTLSMELQFYLIWPLLFMGLHRLHPRQLRRNVGLVSLVGALLSALLMSIRYLAGSDITRIYYGTDTRVFAFFLGAFLASGFSSRRLVQIYRYFPRAKTTAVGFAALLGMLLLFFVLPGDKAPAYLGGMLLFTLLLLVVMALAAAPSSLLGRVLANPVFVFLGERSYSLYLWQYAIMVLTQMAFRTFNWPVFPSVLLQLFCLLALAELSYLGLEQKRWKLSQNLNPMIWKHGVTPRLLRQSLPLFLLTVFCSLGTVVALLKAPAGVDPQILEMQRRLAENQSLSQLENGADNTTAKKPATPTPSRAISPDGRPAETSEDGERLPGGTSEAVAEAGSPGAGPASTTSPTEGTGVTESPEVANSYPELALTEAEKQTAAQLPLVAIGDSVLQMCAKDLQRLLPQASFQTEVGLQFSDGMKLLEKLKKSGGLSQNILFALGTNGVLQPSMIDELAKTFPDNTLYLMTIVTYQDWETSINEMLRAGVSRHPNLKLIDWYDFAGQKAGLFYPSDGTHPNLAGAPVYAQFVAKNILSKVGE